MKPSDEDLSEQVELVRAAANEVLARARTESSTAEVAAALEKAASALKVAAEIRRAQSEATKFREEVAKLRWENSTSQRRERSEVIRDYVSLLTPLVTVVTLGATLMFQGWQFVKSEEAKREQTLDAQWQEAVKHISASGALSPGVVALQPFLRSDRYREQAKDVAMNVLSNSSDTAFFNNLFGTALGAVSWDELRRLVQVNRSVYARVNPLYHKTWDAKKGINDLQRLGKEELATYQYGETVIPALTSNIGVILKTPRPANFSLDLSSTFAKDSKWSGADLRGANIEGAYLLRMDIRDADLSDIVRFEGAEIRETAWWQARSISAPMLKYLEARWPFAPGVRYGPNLSTHTRQEYEEALRRLYGILR